MPDAVLHLSALAGSPLLDSAGDKLGRVQDVVARLGGSDGQLPVVGLKAQIGGRESFVPIDRVAGLEPSAARLATTKINLAPFERRPGEVLLREDVLDHSLIDVTTAQLVKAREVELVCDGGRWRVAGIDPSFGVRLRRLLPKKFGTHDEEHRAFVAWENLEAFVGHVPTSRLKLARQRILRLHPAQIADLVEAASHEEGEEILEAVGEDKELEADVFEELNDEHQVEFLRERSDQEVADVLARMESDDAADLLLELDQERRLPVLERMPPAKQRTVRRLLGYNPSTAGGLMNPDFVSTTSAATAEEVLRRIRSTELQPQHLSIVLVLDEQGRFVGSLALTELIRARPDERLEAIAEASTPSVALETELPEVARLMADYNLIALPVLDEAGHPVGIIAVDDVLEQVIPEDWRRRAGLART